MVTLKYPHLFTPIRLGNVTLRNRIIASPTGGPAIMPPQYITRETAAFWELRAKGGASVVTLGDNVVDSETGLMHPHKMRIDDSGIIPSLTNTARYITQYGAVASLELEHDSAFPATTPKRVLVVGGGPAGLMAACTAAQRGHHVILCEASDCFGSLLKCEAHDSMSKGIIDGIVNVPTTFWQQKMGDIAGYMTELEFMAPMTIQSYISDSAIAKLSESQQQAIIDAAHQTLELDTVDLLDSHLTQAYDYFKEANVEIITLGEQDLAGLDAAWETICLNKVAELTKQGYDGQGIYDTVREIVAKYE